MESRVNYTAVGIFVVILTALIIIIGLWLSVGLTHKSYKIYLVHMHESVSGLSQNAPVKYNGVQVGYVDSIHLNLKDPQQVILTLKIESNIPITVGTEAILTAQGLTGIDFIGLRGGKPNEPLLVAKPGQQYPIIKAVPSLLLRLDQAVQSLTTDFKTLSGNVKELLSNQNIKSIQHTLTNMDKISSTIANNSAQIDHSLKSLQTVLANGAKASNELPIVMKTIHNSAQSLQRMANNLSKAGVKVGKLASSGNIAIESFSEQILPQAYDTLESLQTMTNNLKGFTHDLSKNPAVLLRGKQPRAPGPGER